MLDRLRLIFGHLLQRWRRWLRRLRRLRSLRLRLRCPRVGRSQGISVPSRPGPEPAPDRVFSAAISNGSAPGRGSSGRGSSFPAPLHRLPGRTAMLTRPKFKPHLRLATVPEEGVFVLCGATQTLLRGRLYEIVAPRIDGRSADEICELVAEQVSPAEVYFTLGQLESKGLLTEAGDGLSPQ